jgi:hypothetical protein
MSHISSTQNQRFLIICMVLLFSSMIFWILLSDQSHAASSNQLTNQPPVINFTPLQTQVSPAVYTFDIVVTDDGQPVPPGDIDGSVEFIGYGTHVITNLPDPASGNITNYTAGSSLHILKESNHYTLTLSAPGSLLLRVTASDGELTTVKEWTFTVDDQNSGDIDNDGMPDIWEETYGFDPNDPSDASQDADDDKLINIEEYQNNTVPTDFDTDDDLLPDGFEVNGGLDPLVATDIYADQDVDELINFDELIYSTHPNNADTDNDGTADGTEIEQCSNPNDASDSGQAPPQDEIARIRLTVGDHSGSHSERYNLIVGPITHQAPEFGVVSTRDYCFKVGQTYTIKIVHNGSCPNQCYHTLPDYDYTARVSAVDTPAGIIIDDQDRILGQHDESEPFYAAGKVAYLTIKAPGSTDPSEEGEGVSIELRAFIPCEAITVNFGEGYDVMAFAGDGYSMQTFRALQKVTVDAPPDDTPPNDLIISGPNRFWGESKRYKLHQIEREPDRPSWCWKFKAGEYDNYWYSDTLPVTESNNRVRVYQYPLVRETFTELYLDGGNPAAVEVPDSLIPNLNANIRVDLRKHDGEYQYKLRGAHDGFPAYYLYINGTRVHCYDPLEEGGSPWYLYGGLDVNVNDFEVWHNVSDAQDCDRPLGIRLSYPKIGVGGSTTLTGISFAPESNLSIYMNDSFLKTVNVDDTGKFKIILNATSSDEGIYNISVRSNNPSVSSQSTTVELANTQLIVNKNYPVYEGDDGVPAEINIPGGIAELWSTFLPIITK